jgi:hypothetical protein
MAETWIDPIVAEVRKVREAHAAAFNYDVQAIYRDLKAKESASGRNYVRYAPRPVAGQAQASGG